MKKIGMQMSILMSVTLSVLLSLLGNLMSGRFSVTGFLISTVISIAVSLVIGFLLPMQKVGSAACRKANIEFASLKGRLFTSLISDLIYTPIITLCNVLLGYRGAVAHGAQPPFVPMLLKSLIVSMIVGYVLIFILTPLFLRFLMKRNGVNPAQTGDRKD